MCIRDSTHIETQPNGRSGVASGLRVSDLVFDPTLACSGVRARLRQRKRSPATSSHTSPAPKPTTLTGPRQDLLLNRAMLSVNKTPYVGRFARGWHRLATPEPLAALGTFYAPRRLRTSGASRGRGRGATRATGSRGAPADAAGHWPSATRSATRPRGA